MDENALEQPPTPGPISQSPFSVKPHAQKRPDTQLPRVVAPSSKRLFQNPAMRPRIVRSSLWMVYVRFEAVTVAEQRESSSRKYSHRLHLERSAEMHMLVVACLVR
jgi:hypothetical protein